MPSKTPKRQQIRAKIVDSQAQDDIIDLRKFVDETKRRLITLGFIPPPVWRDTSSAYIKHFGEEEQESEMEEDPIQQLQQNIASVLIKYNFPHQSTALSRHNMRIRHRVTDAHSVEQILIQDNLVLLRCIMQITAPEDYDKVSKSIVCLFEANDKVGNLFEWLLRREVDFHTQNSTMNTLFREDSLRIKVLSNYFKLVGKFYLRRILLPVIMEAKKPTKLLMEEMARVLASMLLDQLEESTISCPDTIRIICALTKEESLNRAPHTLVNALGNLIVLRWISPALIQPDRYEILGEAPDLQERRLLVATAKIIQCAVNSICDDTSGMDEGNEKICSRILSFLIRMPKRADELELIIGVQQDVIVTEVLQLYQEVKVLRDFEAQKLFRHVKLHIDEIEWVWNEVSNTPVQLIFN